MVGTPSVPKADIEPGGRDGLMVPGWQHKEVDPTFTHQALQYLEERAAAPGTPFFLYLAASAPHEPCIESAVPEFARGKSRAGPRGDLVWLYDWMVGEVMNALERLGLAEQTLLLVTSDNGALPGCLGRTYGHKSCGDWRGYKGHIWEAAAIASRSWRAGRAPSSRAARATSWRDSQDLMATVAAIVRQPRNPSPSLTFTQAMPANFG